MSYAALYERCQDFAPPISRTLIADAAAEIVRLPRRPHFYMTDSMLAPDLRGQFIPPGDTEHPLAKYCKGVPMILVARDLNRCWERFVYVKELMHLFDTALEKVSTAPEFEQLVLAMNTPPPGERLESVNSEIMAFWMALGCLCPENLRQEMQRRRELLELTDLEIATALRIPEQHIPRLFAADFKRIMHTLLTNA